MLYTLSHQMYKYEHGLPVTAAEQRAADVRAGEAPAAVRDLRRSLGRAFRGRHRGQPARGAVNPVTGSGASEPTGVLSGVR